MTPLEAQCRWLMRGSAEVWAGDNLASLSGLPDNSVDAIVTDPPYGLGKEPDALAMLRDWMIEGHHDHKGGAGFMGKTWDAFVPQPALWRECFRVLKPGGHVLAFAGTRTQDLMCLGLRIAGFEIRDLVAWVYGSGFPKSLDVSKAIDKAAGATREVVGRAVYGDGHVQNSSESIGYGGSDPAADQRLVTAANTADARQWQGWGTALKPALEPITLARKPLTGTVAANVLAHGTGALNIDGCRVAGTVTINPQARGVGNISTSGHSGQRDTGLERVSDAGRWPANLAHDGSDEVLGAFPANAGASAPASGATYEGPSKSGSMAGAFSGMHGRPPAFHADGGSAARFFYCAKASKRDRNEGLEGFAAAKVNDGRAVDADNAYQRGATERANSHPTVKPTDLMRWLCRLVTPPGGLILDPFAGSGSTGKAAVLEGFRFLGLELSDEYAAIANARIGAARERA